LDDGSVIAGSARILDWLEGQHPEPRLMPDDPAQREQVLALQRRFDEDITPRIRRAVLDALLRRPRYFAAVFGEAETPLKQRLYSLIVPLAAPLVRKGNGISGPAAVADGIAAAHEAMDFVADGARATGYLVGDRLTLADITAATALATLVRPANSPMQSPQPVDSLFAKLIAPFQTHPGAQWVRDIYARHRGASADFEGAEPLLKLFRRENVWRAFFEEGRQALCVVRRCRGRRSWRAFSSSVSGRPSSRRAIHCLCQRATKRRPGGNALPPSPAPRPAPASSATTRVSRPLAWASVADSRRPSSRISVASAGPASLQQSRPARPDTSRSRAS
jgi:glutathione S-transferase